MTSPRFSLIPVMDHEIHVTEWGEPSRPALMLWHGLARTGRDFDELARALSERYFVLCPDTIGRGLSSWAQSPASEYSIEVYAGIASDLLDTYGITRTAWLGTSMGGMIGMRLASGPHADRISCLILNDIGPEIPEEAIARILQYVGDLPMFSKVSEAERWLRKTYLPFGPAADAFWRRMARSSVRRKEDGRLTLHYDPQITLQFVESPEELLVWERWERISAPTHVFRGAQSDLLPEGIATRMQDCGPRPEVTVLEECGHAPTLSRPGDIEIVDRLLKDFMA